MTVPLNFTFCCCHISATRELRGATRSHDRPNTYRRPTSIWAFTPDAATYRGWWASAVTLLSDRGASSVPVRCHVIGGLLHVALVLVSAAVRLSRFSLSL